MWVKLKKPIIYIAVILFVIACIGLILYITFGGTTEPEQQPEPTITETDSKNATVEVLQSQDSLSNILAAFESAGMTGNLDGQVTVFAPNNQAFEGLPEGANFDAALNKDIAGYHIARGIYKVNDLADNQKIPTTSGQELVVSVEEDAKYMLDAKGNKATILASDIETEAGLIHEIDRVLLTQ
jgi:uncharacterized surface protein with fasciclin (FAS1) repeats